MRPSAAALLLVALFAPVAQAQDPLEAAFESAFLAWDRGDYVPALEGFVRVLEAEGGDRYFERIALLTGELHPTIEITADGRSARMSPDGRFVAYETSVDGEPRIRIAPITSEGQKAAEVEVQGTGLVFAPTGARAVYLRVPETAEITRARAEMERALQARERAAYFRFRDELRYTAAKAARVVVRELTSGRERELDTGDLLVVSVAWSADGSTVYAVGAPDGASTSRIYALSASREPVVVTSGEGSRTEPIAVAGGRYLVHRVVEESPIPRAPGVNLARVASGESGERIAVLDLRTGTERLFPGTAPTVAANGSAVAWLVGEACETSTGECRGRVPRIEVLHLQGGDPVTVAEGGRLVRPVLSPDGERVAYQRMLREDWEVFAADTRGASPGVETRVTHDIQHDLYPRFLSPTEVLVVKGEGRHRRSYLYDLETGEERRLFHNNTIRTIAPEYEWDASADGTKLVIVAERDGDTVSPERGVYLVDLSRRLTKADLLRRISANLLLEQDLRERGREMFEPIAEEVRGVVAGVSRTKLYTYQKALFGFDSKYITEPGNGKAIAYLVETLESWGYEPELQWFEPRPGIRTANVIARLPGTVHPELMYVVGSHFDSSQRGPGADDNTSGTSMLLETARVLRDNPLPATVVFAFFTGEEAGLLGSREFARRAEAEGWNVRVLGALNNDMMGYANDHHLDNTIRYSNAGIRDVQHAAAFLFSDLVTYDARYYKSTDAHALFDAFGDVIGGIGSYPVLANPHYHQSHDVLETINQELVRETTRTNVASIMLLASSPARLKGLEATRRGDDVVEVRWNPAPEHGIREYVVVYGPETNPDLEQVVVTEPSIEIGGVERGWVVSVKAVNDRGLVGWDWASMEVPE